MRSPAQEKKGKGLARVDGLSFIRNRGGGALLALGNLSVDLICGARITLWRNEVKRFLGRSARLRKFERGNGAKGSRPGGVAPGGSRAPAIAASRSVGEARASTALGIGRFPGKSKGGGSGGLLFWPFRRHLFAYVRWGAAFLAGARPPLAFRLQRGREQREKLAGALSRKRPKSPPEKGLCTERRFAMTQFHPSQEDSPRSNQGADAAQSTGRPPQQQQPDRSKMADQLQQQSQQRQQQQQQAQNPESISAPGYQSIQAQGAAPQGWQKNLCVGILAVDGFEQAELLEPLKALKAAGIQTQIISEKPGDIQGFKHTEKGETVSAEISFDEACEQTYDALVLPGGVVNGDAIRVIEAAQQCVRQANQANKPIAVVCHGPWLMVSANIVQGRTLTSWPSLKDDIRNAGGTWVDQEVCVDGNFISSRKPDDLPAFCETLIAALQQNAGQSQNQHQSQSGSRARDEITAEDA